MVRVCRKCKQSLPLEMFGKDKIQKDGLRTRCKQCDVEAARKYRAANPEKSRENTRRWRMANLEKAREYDHIYQKNNPDKNRRKGHLRRARIKGNGGGTYTKSDWDLILWIYDNRCLMCGAEFLPKHLTVDHIISIVNGGTNDPGNLQPLCHNCNCRKERKNLDLRDVRDRDWC